MRQTIVVVGSLDETTLGLPSTVDVVRVERLADAPEADVIVMGPDAPAGHDVGALARTGAYIVRVVPRGRADSLRKGVVLSPERPVAIEDTPLERVHEAVRRAVMAKYLRAIPSDPLGHARVGSAALDAFWEVLRPIRDDVEATLATRIVTIPEYALLLATQDPEEAAARATRSRALQDAAFDRGAWGPYLEHLHDDGRLYARLGLAFGAWFDLAALFRAAFLEHSPTLTAPVVKGLGQFLDLAMKAIGEGYLAHRDEIETAAAEQTELYAAMVSATSDAIIIVDLDDRITGWNAGAEALFGYAPSEILGQDFGVLVPDHLMVERSALRERVLGGDPIQGLHTVRRRRDGTPVHVAITVSAVPDPQGRPIGLSTIARDIGELVHTRRSLERTVRDLVRSNEDLEQFAYVASHDLQEPLRMVTAYMELLDRDYAGQLDEDARTYIRFASGGARRMKRLVDSLLAFSRIDGRGGDFVEVDLSEVLQEVWHDLGAAVDAAGATLIAAPLPRVMGDQPQLAQVLRNLVGNALKFRGDDPPEIRVTSHARRDEWAVCVADNGIGFDPAKREDIFGMFTRLHDRSLYDGDGIGLALVRRIVGRHGGRIFAASEPGRGAIFTFTLPRYPQESS